MRTPRRKRHTGDGRHFCAICNELVKLETAKTDGDGHAVHDECYLDKISGTIQFSSQEATSNAALVQGPLS